MRTLISIFIFFFSTVSLFAQTEESNKYFNQGMELYNQGKYTDAIPCFEKSDSIDKVTLDSTSNRREYSAMWLASCYKYLGDSVKAKSLSIYSFQVPVNRNLTVQSDSLAEIASKLDAESKFEEAFSYAKSASLIEKQNLGDKSLWYANSLCAISFDLFKMQKFEEAIRTLKDALKIKKELLKCHHDLLVIQHWLSLMNYTMGNYIDAVYYEEEALNSKKALTSTKDVEYFTLMGNIVLYQHLLGNTDYALKIDLELLQSYKEIYGEYNVAMLGNIATFYSQLGEKEKALHYIKESINLYEKSSIKKDENYFSRMGVLMSLNIDLGKYEVAENLGTEMLKLIENKYGCNNYTYVNTLTVIAQAKFMQNKINEAINMQKQVVNIRRKIHWGAADDAMSLRVMAIFYWVNKEYNKATQFAIESTEMISDIVLKTFRNLTIAEQKLFWQRQNDWYFDILPVYAHSMGGASLIGTLYNATLLSKGLLLNAEIEMKKVLSDNKDKALLSLYNDILQYKNILENTIDEEEIQKMYSIVERKEKELLAKSKEYCDYTKKLAIKWQDVKNNLGERDVAIEFVTIPIKGNRKIYSAIVLRKSQNSPIMINLFEEQQLNNIKRDSLYLSKSLSDLVWTPLLPYLKNIKNIYFSPVGILHNVAIEYANNKPSSIRQCSFYRLSSTRQLVTRDLHKNVKNAVLFGGLNYDSKGSTAYDSQDKDSGLRSIDIDSLNIRNGCQYLPETKEEVISIKKRLETLHFKDIITLTDTLGTENSFKKLSGKGTGIIHIATHGFYWTEKEAFAYNDEYKNILGGVIKYDTEDKALTRSGLLLTGANAALSMRKIKIGKNDGILTAKEISELDLQGLDLVVLSACQTGLGEITGDGVFGLQRGFKKAGAQTLMMSLWKVDDKATQLLMSRFYSNLITGKNKIESLRDAQKYVREFETEVEVKADNKTAISAHAKEQLQQSSTQQKIIKKVHPYKDPKYWAAFILLDALN